MKTTLALASIFALSVPVLAGCADPSRAVEAGDLRDELASMPGVVSAQLDYTEPLTLDSGKLELRVEMDPGASADQVSEVVATTYTAFEGVHHDEEGDLHVTIGDDAVHLRSFQPDAETADVAAAAERAVAVLPSGTVSAGIDTQDVSAAPHVHTQYDVVVAEPGAEGLLSTLASLEAAHSGIPHAGWTVRSSDDSWGITAADGFPDHGQLDRFDQLREGLPANAAIWLGEDDLTLRLSPDTSPTDASAVVGRQLALVGGARNAFYEVQQGEDSLAMFLDGECFFDDGTAGALLEKDHGGECTDVKHPEPA
ncbi:MULTISPECIES: hypothetical protein [unclassified Nocardioides]|uniref:hypothetical protein n=1 Tax=unclassified Nocardioides TaxID=2615069 RepID=UPI0006F66248|nr:MULTISPECIES: hypothetical protein [unclassified Nocardioides]KRA38841.1 hypothetical protein ASD81_09695 [Nocardioides sp. Root614]KRA92801.1 hypothetical protein ASD84_09960 [Nocardioides sp. Root682]